MPADQHRAGSTGSWVAGGKWARGLCHYRCLRPQPSLEGERPQASRGKSQDAHLDIPHSFSERSRGDCRECPTVPGAERKIREQSDGASLYFSGEPQTLTKSSATHS